MSNHDLSRLLRPQSIAVVGGSWSRSVVEQCVRMQYQGDIWPVHPELNQVHGFKCYRTVDELPAVPDATFIGVNRHLTVDIVKKLALSDAGGAVCFASGFSEAAAEDEASVELQNQLLDAASGMPIIGPNCYGLINYLDGALLWPDQHGGKRVERGVAIITQSSNIAINMTMQRRGLPIAYVMTAGNQAKVSIADMAMALLDDERVTAIGLHIEGFGDIAGLQQLAEKARHCGIARGRHIGIVVIKAGKTEQSQTAMVSHTNSLSGTDAASSALIERLGFARLNSIPSFLESLKLLHVYGPLSANTIASMSCSGGEASLMADAIAERNLVYPQLGTEQKTALRAALGPMVALANPLDYHTYIWGDLPAMTATFTAMLQSPAAMTFLVIDFPRTDVCEDDGWWIAVDALIAARDKTGAPVALLATLPENLPEEVCERLMQNNVCAFGGVEEALDAVVACSLIGQASRDNVSGNQSNTPPPAILQSNVALHNATALTEFQSKCLLQKAGLPVASAVEVATVEDAVTATADTGYPLVLKVSGVAHKTEQNGVVLNVKTEDELREHATRLLQHSDRLLVEPFYQNVVAELLVGIVREPDGLFKLTIGSGGVLTELIRDTTCMLLPVTEEQLLLQLENLRITNVLRGYRGQPGADLASIVQTVIKLCEWLESNCDTIAEVEINPLLCLQDKAVVVDALITSSELLSKEV